MDREIKWADAVGGASFEQHDKECFRFAGLEDQYKLSS